MGISRENAKKRNGAKRRVARNSNYVTPRPPRRHGLVRRQRQDVLTVDVLAAPAPEVYFGKITSCEFERTGPRARGQDGRAPAQSLRAHLTMDCYRARWLLLIGALDDLSAMPAIEALAGDAGHFFVIEAIVDSDLYDELATRSSTQQPHLHEGNWIQLSLSADMAQDRGVPCLAWLPADDSADPMTIGADGQSLPMRLYEVRRVTPFSLRRALMKFGDAYEHVDSDPVAAA